MTNLVDVIDAGRRRAVDAGCEDPTTADAVWELVMEAADTLKRMPDRERGWLASCDRSQWPETMRQFIEEFSKAVARGGEWEEVRVRLGPPSAAAISRMDVVLGWLGKVQGRHRTRDMRILFALGSGVPVRVIRRRFGLAARTVYSARDRALNHISLWLESELAKPD